MGPKAPKDNSAKVAKIQAEIRDKELQFEREEAARQATRQTALDAWQKQNDERRYTLDLKADARADSAASFNQSMGQQQLAYQQSRDAQLFGLQQQELQGLCNHLRLPPPWCKLSAARVARAFCLSHIYL